MRKIIPYIALIAIGSLYIGHALLQITPKALSYEVKSEYPKEIEFIVQYNWTKERINQEIDEVAEKYNVSPQVMKTVVECESTYKIDALGDSANSRGLVQIHKKYHPHITNEQANDPEFALTFLAEKLSKKQGYLWSCYNQNYSL